MRLNLEAYLHTERLSKYQHTSPAVCFSVASHFVARQSRLRSTSIDCVIGRCIFMSPFEEEEEPLRKKLVTEDDVHAICHFVAIMIMVSNSLFASFVSESHSLALSGVGIQICAHDCMQYVCIRVLKLIRPPSKASDWRRKLGTATGNLQVAAMSVLQLWTYIFVGCN